MCILLQSQVIKSFWKTLHPSAESSSAVEYLGEIEFEFENTLACLSGAQTGSNHEKNRGRKSRDTLPLKCLFDYTEQ